MDKQRALITLLTPIQLEIAGMYGLEDEQGIDAAAAVGLCSLQQRLSFQACMWRRLTVSCVGYLKMQLALILHADDDSIKYNTMAGTFAMLRRAGIKLQ